jgi:filamentous hemagglutinin family protein
VISGSATITQVGNTTDIRQSSADVAIDWLSFSVGSEETVDFLQPSASAVAVNRIEGSNGSEILGHLDANGQVYLINPNGIIFRKGAEVNVGGLVASTLDVSESSLGDSSRSFSGGATGSIVNEGTIVAANGGYVALVGNRVSNEGVIRARLGTVALGSGSAVTLDFSGNRLVQLQVDRSTLNDLAENKQLIEADGGLVIMTAGAERALLASVVNNTGIIEARTVENHEGTIELVGGMSAGTVKVGGTLDASAAQGGNGGFIETDAAHVEVSNDATVTTAASKGLTGSWLIDPEDFTVAPSGGDITGAALSKALNATSVTLESSAGTQAPSGSGNVNIDDAVSWSANTRLTLTAANNVNVNENITATGSTAVLFIKPDTTNGSETANGTGTFDLQAGTSITLSGTNASLWITTASYTLGTGAQVNLANVSPTSTTALVIGGSDYTVINSLGAAGSTTGTDLQGIEGKLSGHYALGSNIDASATASWNSNGAATPVYAGFTPIGSSTAPFTGTFEGLGHTISDLTIDLPTTSDVGLIGKSGKTAVIQDVGLIGGSVSGSNYVGALVGQSGGAVSNSYATGSVAGVSAVGGLLGQTSGALTDSYATGSVAGTGNGVGGLVGQNNGSISDSYATASTVGFALEVGGLVGQNAAAVSNSYATGNVSGVGDVGGLVGYNVGAHSAIGTSYAVGKVSASGSNKGGLVGANTGNVAESYWDVITSGQSASAGGTGLTTVQTASYLTGFNFTSTPDTSGNNWVLVDINGSLNNAGGAQGATFPMLASEYTTRIDNAHQLQLMAMNTAATYTLDQNIDASATGASTDVWGSSGFIPIGSASAAFTGTLDGLGHSVSGLTINLPSNVYVGLIGDAGTGSVIEEVGLVGGSISGLTVVSALVGQNSGTVSNSYSTVNVTGGRLVGGLVGNNYGTVTNSYATGQMIGTGNYSGAGCYVGGLVGENHGVVSNSYATGQVASIGEYVGGLVGYNSSAGTVNESHATGSVTATGNGTSTGVEVGGLAGENVGAVNSSYSTGNVSGNGDVGGLIGGNEGTINTSNASGQVTGVISGIDLVEGSRSNPFLLEGVYGGLTIGGLVGENSGTVGSSYATGGVSGLSYLGGLAGYNLGTINNSHAVGNVSTTNYFTSYFVGSFATDAGGLVGSNKQGTINTSYATGNVTGTTNVGGLVGNNTGSAVDTYATGSVSGASYVGGLVGSGGSISSSHATGDVSGTGNDIGGLAGGGNGISASYATGSVSGASYVGGLVGSGSGISSSHATGDVSGTGNSVGGLIGYSAGPISSSYARGNVIGGSDVGGLVGEVVSGTVSTSYVTGNVSGTGNDVGGLVGKNSGATLSGSYGTGSVSGASYVGGLVGYNIGMSGSSPMISTSHATGSVSGAGNYVGGLVGYNSSGTTVNSSYATGKVNGASYTGGLVGYNTGTVNISYATGEVTGTKNVGGLVGDNVGGVANTFATADVSGSSNVGGLVGINTGTVSTSYATGSVSGSSEVGGLIGDTPGLGAVSASFWNVTTSGLTSSAGGTGMTTAQMQTETNFTSAGWNFTSIWYMPSGSYPQLQAFMTP